MADTSNDIAYFLELLKRVPHKSSGTGPSLMNRLDQNYQHPVDDDRRNESPHTFLDYKNYYLNPKPNYSSLYDPYLRGAYRQRGSVVHGQDQGQGRFQVTPYQVNDFAGAMSQNYWNDVGKGLGLSKYLGSVSLPGTDNVGGTLSNAAGYNDIGQNKP